MLVCVSLLQARRRQVREGATKGPGLVAGLRMLARSALFVKLTICVMISGIVMEGMYNLLAPVLPAQAGVHRAGPGGGPNTLNLNKSRTL